MKECSLDHFMESLQPWLDNEYIRNITIDHEGRISFLFRDGVRDTYNITDCNRDRVLNICKDLSEHGIPIKEV